MRISLHWLREFVDVPVDPPRLRSDLTMLGLNVESLAQAGDDWVFDVEVTTNRPDCLSHYGIARELATLYRKPLKPLEFAVKVSAKPAATEVSIEIADPDLCARYCGRVIENVQVKPSPEWLRKRLEAVGQRPVNNVADVTNYALLELGHPLHAFDLSRLKQKKVIVRRARAGERLRTLDATDRPLVREDLVIADAERAVALAGVMGGEDSEISPATRSVLLESAWFEPLSVRRTAKSQGMHTEASHRFERGADVEMAPVAIDRAAALIAELAGGEVLAGVVDAYPRRKPREDVTLRSCEIARILGAEIPAEEVERILKSLGFRVERTGVDSWRVTPPSFRWDVAREIDLIEEVARHYGYDRLPARVRPAPPRPDPVGAVREKELTVSAVLVGLGYREVISYSMVDPQENARFTDRPPVALLNPLSQEASVLRSTTVPSMVRALRWNLDRDQNDLRFFEQGKTYTAMDGGDRLPDERRVLTLGLSGHRRPASVHDSERPVDFFDLKGDLEALVEVFDLGEVRFEPEGCHYHEAGLGGRFVAGGETLVVCGRLKSELANDYKLRQPVWLAEVDLDGLLRAPLRSRIFRPFSKFPAVERDFSLVLPEGLPYSRLVVALRALGMEEIQGFRPVDVFRGGAIPAGQYSLLLRVTFQSAERTLTSDELNELGRRLLAALEPLGIHVRS